MVRGLVVSLPSSAFFPSIPGPLIASNYSEECV
jgi:hypothetical protein